jgi:hypothetical protein
MLFLTLSKLKLHKIFHHNKYTSMVYKAIEDYLTKRLKESFDFLMFIAFVSFIVYYIYAEPLSKITHYKCVSPIFFYTIYILYCGFIIYLRKHGKYHAQPLEHLAIQEYLVDMRVLGVLGADDTDTAFIIEDEDDGPIENDPQNVHDHGINQYLCDSIKSLQKQCPTPISTEQTLVDIRQMLTTKAVKPDAYDVLDHIELIDGTHSKTQLHETQILALIWTRINQPINKPVVEDLKNSLVQQLEACKQNDYIVCTTGRISRIVQTLESIDVGRVVNLLPMWAIRAEIGEYCGKYVKKLLAKLPEEYNKAVNATEETSEQKVLTKRFYDCVKNNLKKKFKLIYLDKMILTQDELKRITDEYFDSLR